MAAMLANLSATDMHDDLVDIEALTKSWHFELLNTIGFEASQDEDQRIADLTQRPRRVGNPQVL